MAQSYDKYGWAMYYHNFPIFLFVQTHCQIKFKNLEAPFLKYRLQGRVSRKDAKTQRRDKRKNRWCHAKTQRKDRKYNWYTHSLHFYSSVITPLHRLHFSGPLHALAWKIQLCSSLRLCVFAWARPCPSPRLRASARELSFPLSFSASWHELRSCRYAAPVLTLRLGVFAWARPCPRFYQTPAEGIRNSRHS